MARRTGAITLYIGPMGSGKTARAISDGTREALAGGRVLVIKHASDTRALGTLCGARKDMVTSRDGRSLTAAMYTSDLGTVEVPPDTTLIIVDEGQFFDAPGPSGTSPSARRGGLVEFCLAQQLLGRSVIVTALNSYADDHRTAWPSVLELIPKATRVKSLTAICVRCHGQAECTRRLPGLGPGHWTSEEGAKPVVHIGGDESYVATCAGCYTLPISNEILKRRQGIFDWLSPAGRAPEQRLETESPEA